MISLLLNKYVLGGVLVAALLAGCAFAYWHHGNVRYGEGIAAQRAAEAKSLAIYTQARNAQLASAEASYHAEIDSLKLHPIDIGPVRLCDNLPSGAGAGQSSPGPVGSGAGTADVQHLPTADHPAGAAQHPDISNLLGLLAGRADDTAAQLRALIEVSK